MQLRQIMTPQVEVVSLHDTISTAATLMRRLDVGSLPVCDGTRVVGMITDRDITIRATAAGSDPTLTKVSECMSRETFFCYEHQDSLDAEALMQEHQIRRVPILNKEHQLVGIVALADLVTKTAEIDEIDRTIWNISQPEHPAHSEK